MPTTGFKWRLTLAFVLTFFYWDSYFPKSERGRFFELNYFWWGQNRTIFAKKSHMEILIRFDNLHAFFCREFNIRRFKTPWNNHSLWTCLINTMSDNKLMITIEHEVITVCNFLHNSSNLLTRNSTGLKMFKSWCIPVSYKKQTSFYLLWKFNVLP